MSLKTKALKHGISKDEQPPIYSGNVAVALWVEDRLEENGYNINRGAGVDLPDEKVEVKARCINSKSHHTVATMTTKYIINTPYNQSNVRLKLQQQYRFKYDMCGNQTAKIYDFSEHYIQNLIEKAYEEGRHEISQGMKGKNNTRVNGTIGMFQRVKGKELWQFRLTPKGMRIIETISMQKSFHDLFGV